MATIATPARDLLGPLISSLFDPNPIGFRESDERGVRPVRQACAAASAVPISLTRLLNRNAFLCGCLDFTESEPIEHLIVGFGERRGNTTRVEALAHMVGSVDQVQVPAQLADRIVSWTAVSFRSEVLVFHNHPANRLNALFDNVPIASHPDRLVLLRHYLQPALALKAALGGGRVRFYVGENGFAGEFHMPNVMMALTYLP